MVPGQALGRQPGAALAAVGREVDRDEVELRWRGLPLDEDEILRAGIVRPGGGRRDEFGPATADRGGWQARQQGFVEPDYFWIRQRARTAAQVDAQLPDGSGQLAVVQESHPRQSKHEQGGGAMFLEGETGRDARLVLILQKMGATPDEIGWRVEQVTLRFLGLPLDQPVVETLVIGVVETERLEPRLHVPVGFSQKEKIGLDGFDGRDGLRPKLGGG